MSQYQNKWAVITGATSAIGRALTIKCMELKINAVLIDQDGIESSSMESKYSSHDPSVRVLSYKCDCSNERDIKQMITAFKRDYGSNPIMIHFLFNNVGNSPSVNILNGDLKQMHKMMNINLWGMIYITQSFLPFLQATSPSMTIENDDRFIVNTSSIASLATADSFYAITKHGVNAMTQAFESELKEYNTNCIKQRNGRGVINVSCLVPSFVESSMMEKVGDAHQIDNVLDKLNKLKANDLGINNPSMWKTDAFNPSILADIVFEEAIKKKHFWIHTHKDWSKCVSYDRFYTFYTQKFNQYEATEKILNKYKENMKKIHKEKASKL